MPKLVMKTGRSAGKSFALSGPCILGRGDTAQIQVFDAKASREHCRVFEQGNQWVVVDLNSRNGITVNGVSKTRHTLRIGDEIAIGETIAVFQARTSEAASAVQPSSPKKSERMAPPELSEKQKKAKAERDKAFAAARAKSGGGSGSGSGGSSRGPKRTAADGSVAVSDRVLQFSNEKTGALRMDLSQMPFYQKFILFVLMLAVLGGLAYGLKLAFGSGG